MATPRHRTHFIISLVASFIESLKRDMVGEAGAVTDPQHDHGGASGSSGTGAVTGSTAADGTGATGADGTGAVTGATGADGTGAVTGNSDTTSVARIVGFQAPAAAGVDVHAAIASDNAAPVTTALTNPAIPRSLQVVFTALWDGGDVTVQGTDQFDNPITEVIADNPGATVQGVKVFKTVTSINQQTVGAGGGLTATVQTGTKLGLDVAIDGAGIGLAHVDGAADAATFDSTYEGVTFASAPNGAKNYVVSYMALHRHGAGTLAGPSHTHGAGTLAGPSHTHTGPSHTHGAGTLAGPSHTHTVAAGATGVTVAGGGTAIHYDQAEYAVDTAIASDLATSIALAKALIYAYLRHVADTLAHAAADTTNDLDDGVAAEMAADVVDLNSAIEVANGIKAAYNAHRSQAGVHPTNDAGHAITSLDATDQGSLNTLLNELKTDLNAHMASGLSTPSWRVES
jgi:hypothetical protein